MEHLVQIGVKGRVQGVGFRAFTRAEAQRMGLAGWVRNRPDGSVEVVVQLAPVQREPFLAALKQGPPGSQVTDLQIAPAAEGTTLTNGRFEVRW